MDKRVFLFIFQKDFVSLWHVVEIRTGIHTDFVGIDVFIEVLHDVGVVQRLIGRMPVIIYTMATIGDDVVLKG